MGREISAFSGVLRDLHEFLDDAKDLISKRALLNANHILRDCKNVFANIQRMLESCQVGTRMNFWHSLQWSFRREKVKPMYARLESFKLILAVLLSTLRLARCKQEIGNRSGSNYPSSLFADLMVANRQHHAAKSRDTEQILRLTFLTTRPQSSAGTVSKLRLRALVVLMPIRHRSRIPPHRPRNSNGSLISCLTSRHSHRL